MEEEEEASTPEVAHHCLTDLIEPFPSDHNVDVVHTSTTSSLLEVITLEEESLLDSSLPSPLLFDVTSVEVTTIEEHSLLDASLDTTIEDSLISSSVDDTTKDSSLLLADPLDSLMPATTNLFTHPSIPRDTWKIAHYLSSPSENCVPTS